MRKLVYAIYEQQRRRSACASEDRVSRDVAHIPLFQINSSSFENSKQMERQ